MDAGKKTGERGDIRSVSPIDALFAVTLIGFPLYVYSRTLSPTVNYIDSGELISVSYLLGIAHPTGYPLYTLWGRLFSLFGGDPPAASINLMSAVFSSFASLLTGAVVFFVLGLERDHTGSWVSRGPRYIVSLTSGLLFAFSRTMWQVSTETEVYAMAAFFFAALFLISVPILSFRAGEGSFPPLTAHRGLPAFGYIWGLAMGNHMGIVLMLPLAVHLLCSERVWERGKRWGAFFFLVFFLIGFSVYLYIPIRSLQDPPLNWGDPHDIRSFFRHMTGWQYRIWMFSGDLFRNAADYVVLLLDQFHPAALILVPPGAIFLFKRRRPLLIALTSLFLSDLIYSLNYDIPDIDPYFIPSFFVIVVLIGTGLHHVAVRIAGRRAALALPLTALSFVLPVTAIQRNYWVCDRSEDYAAYELAVNLFSTVEEGAVVLTKTWDLYAPVMYLQRVEGKRNDVVMIDYELMRRSWYVRGMMSAYPDLFLPIRRETGVFLDLVAAFEEGVSYDSRRLESAFHTMLNAVVLSGYPERPAYIDFDDDPLIAPSLIKEPKGMIFRLQEAHDDESFDIDRYRLTATLHPTIYRDERAMWNRSRYPRYAVKKAIHLHEAGKYVEAVESLEDALLFDRDDPLVLHLMADSYFRMNHLARARGCYRRLIELTPGDPQARKMLEMIERMIRGES